MIVYTTIIATIWILILFALYGDDDANLLFIQIITLVPIFGRIFGAW